MDYKKNRDTIEPIELAYDDPEEDPMPEERLERITDIIARTLLRLVEEENANVPKNNLLLYFTFLFYIIFTYKLWEVQYGKIQQELWARNGQ